MHVLKYVEDAEDRDEETRGEFDHLLRKLWGKLLLLPSDKAWYTCNLILCYASVMGNILLSVNGKCLTSYREYNFIVMFYVMDVISLMDTVLQSLSMIFLTTTTSLKLSTRPIWIMVFELLSIIPFEQIVSDNPKLFCVLRLNRALKMVLICYYNTKRNWQITSSWVSKLREFLSILSFLVVATFGLYCNLMCFTENECEDQYCDGQDYLAAIASAVTCTGFLNLPRDNYFKIICVIVQMFVFYFVCSSAIAHCTVGQVSRHFNQISYSSCCLALLDMLKRNKATKYLVSRVNEEFHLIWNMKRNKCFHLRWEGFGNGQSFLHPSMYNELQIDIAWTVFKHSHLFRDMHNHYLRYVARYILLEYKLPGEYIYLKGQWKNKMIYISSGTIEILSNEDEQSSILSLCEGTCIGEACLLLSYKSSHYIRCKTFCEFHILRKRDFLRSYKLFNSKHREAKETILNRFRETEVLHEQSTKAKGLLERRRGNVDSYTLLWIKNTLHRLMCVDADSTFRHEFQNIYLINEVKASEFKKLLFHANYLDMLVVRERLEVDVDSVFVRTKFPFIFQPYSVIGILWNSIIILFTLALSVLLPMYAFLEHDMPDWYVWFEVVVTHVFLLDVFIQLCTARKRRHGLTLNFVSTAKARLQTIGIWADIIAFVPMEMFLCIITSSHEKQYIVQAHLNRLAKLWKIAQILNAWDEQFNANKLVIRYIKYVIGMLYITFLVFCVLGYFIPSDNRMALLCEAVQMITGTNVYAKYSPPDLFATLFNFFCITVMVLFTGQIISGYIMDSLPRYQAQDISTAVFKLLISNHLFSKYEQRILDIVHIEWFDNKCNRLKWKEEVMCEMPEKSYQDYMMDNVGDILKACRCFQTLPEDFIYDICAIVTEVIIPPNEAIVYSGDIISNISIVYEGTFNIFDGYGLCIKTVNRSRKSTTLPTTVNLMESYLKIPTVYTHVTVTHCKSLNLNVKHLKSIANKYCYETMDFYTVLDHKCADIKARMEEMVTENEHFPDLSSGRTQKNIFTFPWHLPEDSYVEYDYHVPFDRLYSFSFIRFFLMRSTINPEGTFMFYWEMLRCGCALLTCILSYIVPLVLSSFSAVLFFFDLMALADIYVRLHVAYYADDGLLITHPLLTAKHYVKTSFITDFIAMLPTRVLWPPGPSLLVILSHSNKLLQMYRFASFFQIYYTDRITLAQKSYGITFVPYVLVLSCYCSYYIMLLECDFNEDGPSFNKEGVNCHKDSMFDVSNISRTPYPMVAQIFSIYVAASIVTRSGMQGFIISDNILVLVMVFTLVGLLICVSFAGKFVTLYSFTHTTLLKYQDAMGSLSLYLNNLKVKQSLQKMIVDNYGIKWAILKGRDTHNLLGKFSTPLQYDVLYDLYGKHLYYTSVFKHRKRSFYRNLVPLMKYDVVAKGSYTGRVNDITGDMYILYSGSIDVISFDGELLDNLGPGSIFGNMENKALARLTVMYEVSSHAVYLSIPAVEFHRIISYYPRIQNEFTHLKSKQWRYICKEEFKMSMSMVFTDSMLKTSLKPPKRRFIFKPNTKYMLAWETFVLMYPCYLGLILDGYQSAVQEYSPYLLCVLYSCDLTYIVHYIIKGRTGYLDRSGAFVGDFELVRQRFRNNRFMFIMRVISILPFDIAILLFNMEESTKYLVFGFARFTRFCRLSHFFEYFSQKNYVYNMNMYWMRITHLLMWCFLALNGIASLILIVASLKFEEETNIHPHVPSYTTMYWLTSDKKFDIYVTYLHLAANLLNFTSQPYIYPLGIVEILLFIMIMLLSQHLLFLCYGQMYSLIYQCFQSRLIYRDALTRLNNFMTREDVSAALFTRVITYVKRRWQRRGNDVYPILMDEAPTYIQETILTSVFGNLITRHTVFSCCQRDFLRQVIQKVRSRVFFNGDYIQFEGVIDQCMYFIFQGDVAVYKEERNIDVLQQILKTGDCFGILEGLFEDKTHEYTYMATKNSILLILNFQLWKHLLDFFPNDKQSIYKAAKDFERD